MDIRALTPTYAVSPQISPADLPAIKAAGYVTVIDNRPDAEIPSDLHTTEMRAAAEAMGLQFIANPVIGGAITEENVITQRAAIDRDSGAVRLFAGMAAPDAGKRLIGSRNATPAFRGRA